MSKTHFFGGLFEKTVVNFNNIAVFPPSDGGRGSMQRKRSVSIC